MAIQQPDAAALNAALKQSSASMLASLQQLYAANQPLTPQMFYQSLPNMFPTGPPSNAVHHYNGALRQQLYNGTLRQRMYADPAHEFMEEHGPALKKIIEEDTEHQKVSVRHAWHRQLDRFVVTVVCAGCEKSWTSRQNGEMMVRVLSEDWERAFIRDVLAALIDKAADDACFGIREAAILSEWITERLAAAGERGLPYAQVIHQAVEARLCSPKDVDSTLKALSFASEWVTLGSAGIIMPGGWDGEWSLPILHLPPGHPMRDW